MVAFKTFLRTLLHEVCHHLDYMHLRLQDSFHTQSFFQRESSLFYQLVPREVPPPRWAAQGSTPESDSPGGGARSWDTAVPRSNGSRIAAPLVLAHQAPAGREDDTGGHAWHAS